MHRPAEPPPSRERAGVLAGLAAFGIWGLVPLYWRMLGGVSADRIIAHRVLWSALIFGAATLALPEARRALAAVVASRRRLLLTAAAGWLVGANWLIFIWAVLQGRLTETSLGYYLTPLCSVLLGSLVLGEKLGRWRWAAVGLAGAGVGAKVILAGVFPWIGLSLCVTFGFYGLLKKKAALDALAGLCVETLALTPAAAVWLAWFSDGPGAGPEFFAAESWPRVALLLVGGGIVTAAPLLGYAFAARRLPLSTLGLMQYLTPTMTFAMGIFLFREPFGVGEAAAFGLIWAGLVLYTWAGVRERRRAARVGNEVVPPPPS